MSKTAVTIDDLRHLLFDQPDGKAEATPTLIADLLGTASGSTPYIADFAQVENSPEPHLFIDTVTVHMFTSEEDGAIVVQIDTEPSALRHHFPGKVVRVYLNDGTLWDGKPTD